MSVADGASAASQIEWRLVALGASGRIAATLALLGGLASIVLMWRGLGGVARARKLALSALHFGAVVMAWVLLFQPAVEVEDVSRLPNHVALMVDRSASMRIAERAGIESRAERAASFVDARKDALAKLERERRVDFYGFGAELEATRKEALRTGAPNAPATQLLEGLTTLRARYEGRALAGAIVLSDGADNGKLATLTPEAAKKAIAELDFPIHVVRVGEAEIHDVAISRVHADDFAFVRTALTIETVVRETGGTWPVSSVPVTLTRDGEVVRTVEIPLDGKPGDHKVSFSFTPDHVGTFLYEISLPTLEGDAIPDNNVRRFVLRVVRDKVRVLQVAGRPSWDERALRSLLKHDPNVDLISFFILRTQSDVELVSQDELSLIPFPTEELFNEQLRSFDVVFMQNMNFGPYGMEQYLDEIQRYVEEGGGLVMLGGDLSFTSGGYANTPVAEVLPVELLPPSVPPPSLVDEAPFRVQLSDEGKTHPVTALETDVGSNVATWGKLPELSGLNRVARAKPGMSVLAVHPKLVDEDRQPLPVIVAGDMKKGRTLAFTSDSSWHWGYGSHTYQRFWEGAMRWLIQDPALAILRVTTDATHYTPAGKPKVTLRALTGEYRPAKETAIHLALYDAKPGPKSAARRSEELTTDDQGEAHLELDSLPPGGYRLVARAELSGRHVEREEIFVVEESSRELDDVEAKDALLRLVAEASGGSFGDATRGLDDLRLHPPPVARINSHRSVELWSGWWTLALCTIFLSSYWALRRRWGLS